MKPAISAIQRAERTTSPSRKIARIVVKKVFENAMTVASAIVSLMKARKPSSIAMNAIATRMT